MVFLGRLLLAALICLGVSTSQAQELCKGLLERPARGLRANLPGLATIPSQQMSAIEASFNYGKKVSFGAVGAQMFINPKINVSNIHGENYYLGVPHSLVLEKLGFNFIKGLDGKIMMEFPSSVFEIFNKYELRVKEWIQSGIIKEHEVLRPAFVLERVVDGIKEYGLFSPAIESWPGAEWTLATKVQQFSHKSYYNYVSSGRVPFVNEIFLNHDLSHLSDLYQNPDIMRQYYFYGKSVAASIKKHGEKLDDSGTAFSIHSDAKALRSEYRSVVYGEWFSIPDTSKAAQIRTLIPEYFVPGGPKNLEASVRYLSSLSGAQKKARIEKFVRSAHELILRFGGGIKDVRSYYVFDSYGAGNLKRLAKVIDQASSKSLDFANEANELALAESLPKMVDTLEYMGNFLFATAGEFRDFLLQKKELEYAYAKDASRTYSSIIINDVSGEAHQRVEKAAIDLLARLEIAFYKAVDLSLATSIAYREGRVQRLSVQDRFFQYLKSFSSPGSYTEYAFELNRGSQK